MDNVADSVGGAVPGAVFRLRTSPAYGLGIVTDNEHGHEVLVATVQRRGAAERLLALAGCSERLRGGVPIVLTPDNNTRYRLVAEGDKAPMDPPYFVYKVEGHAAAVAERLGTDQERLVAAGQSEDQAVEKLVLHANAGYLAQAVGTLKALADWEKCVTDAGGAVLSKSEFEAMRRDVEKFRQLEDDVAAGRKIIQDVPASVAEPVGGGDEKPGVLARVFRGGPKKR